MEVIVWGTRIEAPNIPAADSPCAAQQIEGRDVRFGSKATFSALRSDARFTAESDPNSDMPGGR